MNNKCENCDVPLKTGDVIVQMAKGRYFPEQITPTYGDFVRDPEVLEWHDGCFKEFKLVLQAGPYKCLRCHKAIQHSEEVFYITKGTKYSLYHTRPADRGKTMPWIVHAGKCPTGT